MSNPLHLELPASSALDPEVLNVLNERMRRIQLALKTSTNAIDTTTSVQQGTHAQLKATPAAQQTTGAQFWEIDRNSLYIAQAVGASNVWVYAAGLYAAPFTSRPAGLGRYDTGFLFFATDWTVLWRWDGTQWIYLSGMRTALIGQRPFLGPGDVGFLFYATDQAITYRWTVSTWVYQSGTMEDVYANRPTPGANENGFLFWATDWTVLEEWTGTAWIYRSGTREDVFANRPTPAASENGLLFWATDWKVLYEWYGPGPYWSYRSGVRADVIANLPTLAAQDGNFLFHATDYLHLYRWTGSAWEFAPGDPGSGYIVAGNPQGGSWAACNGGSVTIALPNGTTTSVTTPNLTGDVSLLGSASQDSSARAAARSTWESTAQTEDENATHSHGTGNEDATHTHTLTYGAPIGLSTGITASLSFANGMGTESATHTHGSTGTESAVHQHTLTDANAQLKVPSEANGGLGTRFGLTWWMRR